MKIICFTCRKPVMELKTKFRTVLVEVDKGQLHACPTNFRPEEIGEREDDDSGLHYSPMKRAA